MKIEIWDIDHPKDYPGNARKWGCRAIDKVGLDNDIVYVVDGPVTRGSRVATIFTGAGRTGR